MATKNTAKRVAAITVLSADKSARWKLPNTDSETLYTKLESLGYWWDSSAGEWKKGKPPSTSLFKDNDGEATGIIRIRVMGHPEDMPDAIARQKKIYRVSEVSEAYPNRKGPGVRVYITALLED